MIGHDGKLQVTKIKTATLPLVAGQDRSQG